MLRLWDPSYDKEAYEARKKGGKTGDSDAELVELNCQKTFNETEYSYTVYVNSSYEDGIIQKSEITYKVTISGTSSLNVSDIRIPEYTTLSNEQSAGVSSSVTSDSYKVIIDYTADEALRSDNNFGYHNKNLDDQRVNYTSNGYNCT